MKSENVVSKPNWSTTHLVVLMAAMAGCSGATEESTTVVDPPAEPLSTAAEELVADDGMHPIAVSSRGANVLDVYYRGTDNGLYYREFNGQYWQDALGLATGLTSSPVSPPSGRRAVFYRGNDGAVYVKSYDTTWQPALSLGSPNGAPISGGMAAVQHGPPYYAENPHIFVRGADGILYVRWGTANGWTAWQSLNESYVGSPSIVSATINVDYGPTAGFVIFFRAPDNSLRYLKIVEGQSGIIPDPPVSQRLGGSLTSSPAAVSWDHYYRLDVFVRDLNGALQTVASANQGDTWTNFVSLGGGFTGDPVAVSRSTNSIDVFVRGSGNTLYTLPWNGQAWTGWAAITAPFLASPAALAWSSTRLDVLVRGTDSTLKHKAWNAGGPWLPTNGFESMGGTVQ